MRFIKSTHLFKNKAVAVLPLIQISSLQALSYSAIKSSSYCFMLLPSLGALQFTLIHNRGVREKPKGCAREIREVKNDWQDREKVK